MAGSKSGTACLRIEVWRSANGCTFRRESHVQVQQEPKGQTAQRFTTGKGLLTEIGSTKLCCEIIAWKNAATDGLLGHLQYEA